ncbi:radical SAM protein [Hyalangium gracile]|uniref:radical SAM protein n=1 Tax=Hyalangium gracile TaxID=394092 RepID=UPI001CCF148A|nr:radical SAM protein [Hyalangium gracile]
MLTTDTPRPLAPAPTVRFRWLDTLWLQVTGTLCNIACQHCFISCGPKADQVPMMTLAACEEALAEGTRLGMREVYFTGGEPFLHPEIQALVDRALALAPLTIITNGLLLDDARVEWLAERFRTARYSLDLRVSLDGMTAAQNDPVRGRGTFERVVSCLRRLGAAGLSPVVTVVEHETGLEGNAARQAFLEFVRGLGIRQPRVKFLPLLRLGREVRRTHGYEPEEAWGAHALAASVESSLLCASSRIVTAQGVFTCPILIEKPDARLGDSVGQATRDISLKWDACRTCVLDGLRCNT